MSEADPRSRISRATSHPLRARIYRVLKQEAASPVELSKRLDAPLERASYHVRVLHELNLITVIATEQVRGSLKTTYRAVPESTLWKRGHDPGVEEGEIEVEARLDEAIERARVALWTGTLLERPEHQVSTVEVELDEVGWSELIEAIGHLLEQIAISERQSTVRASGDRVARFPAIVSIFSYEAPEGPT